MRENPDKSKQPQRARERGCKREKKQESNSFLLFRESGSSEIKRGEREREKEMARKRTQKNIKEKKRKEKVLHSPVKSIGKTR